MEIETPTPWIASRDNFCVGVIICPRNTGHDRPDTATLAHSSGRKETGTLATHRASIASWEVCILPIGYRLSGERPDLSVEKAKRQVVNRNIYLRGRKDIHTLRQILTVIERINPKQLLIGKREARVFQPHQSHVIYEGEVSRDPATCFDQSRRGEVMKNHSNLDPLPFVFEPKDAKHGFIKSVSGLHHVVVHMIN